MFRESSPLANRRSRDSAPHLAEGEAQLSSAGAWPARLGRQRDRHPSVQFQPPILCNFTPPVACPRSVSIVGHSAIIERDDRGPRRPRRMPEVLSEGLPELSSVACEP